MGSVNENLYNFNAGILSKDACIVIVHTEWNAEIVNKLLEGCKKILKQYGMNNYKIITVPGAFEIPFAVKNFWDTYQNKFEKPQAFIALGCVLRGDTPHFEYVCKAVTDGVLHLNLILPVPTIFGVLTVDNQQQADERTGGVHGNKGEEAALSALKMMALKYS
ncbi:6,7-dimethyl-8-ribityllumazine synthase [Ginsengibacter hankyongi]|uniref:6,7-dimethyl-8-ribityllumazine synthase n=1 Tax=Ginsengibacter hankyongi TaxID=2607284 RepID=A0A5J5IDP3_9BACT|nr:6,7-dimethyl-8-ribityllumazine synthase [Ginsengibacter hankyongi]KAA9036355.1 6,7-dimethyl-8-ribityllumazine synthase [Ginsengibacter hankyongi]